LRGCPRLPTSRANRSGARSSRCRGRRCPWTRSVLRRGVGKRAMERSQGCCLSAGAQGRRHGRPPRGARREVAEKVRRGDRQVRSTRAGGPAIRTRREPNGRASRRGSGRNECRRGPAVSVRPRTAKPEGADDDGAAREEPHEGRGRDRGDFRRADGSTDPREGRRDRFFCSRGGGAGRARASPKGRRRERNGRDGGAAGRRRGRRISREASRRGRQRSRCAEGATFDGRGVGGREQRCGRRGTQGGDRTAVG